MTNITESVERTADKWVARESVSDAPSEPEAPREVAVLDQISITIAFGLLGLTWLTLRNMDGREHRRSRR